MERKVIACLGNPGIKYFLTRHNIGFLVADELSKEFGVKFGYESPMKAYVAKATVENVSVWIVKPDTYMNNSGEAVSVAVKYAGIDPTDGLLVVADDMHFGYGQMRLKTQGSPGGHNGLKSIEAHLKTQIYPRLRMGIGRPAPGQDAADFVLGEFLAAERDGLTKFVEEAKACCLTWVRHGTAKAMDTFNTRKDKESNGKE